MHLSSVIYVILPPAKVSSERKLEEVILYAGVSIIIFIITKQLMC